MMLMIMMLILMLKLMMMLILMLMMIMMLILMLMIMKLILKEGALIAEKIAALFSSGVETSGEPDSVFPTINAVDTSLRQQAQTSGWVITFHPQLLENYLMQGNDLH